MRKKHLIFCYILLLAITSFSQDKGQKSLLWEISGNGMEKPSYLYGTMHVSSRIAFHLPDTFFIAMENCQTIALESDPESWLDEYDEVDNSMYMEYAGYNTQNLYEKDFKVNIPNNQELGSYFGRTHVMINPIMYRTDPYRDNFQEETYLDLFIFQSSKKLGKNFEALERHRETQLLMLKASTPDEKPKEALNFQDAIKIGPKIENAYRDGDIFLLDSLQKLLNISENQWKYFVVERNRNMTRRMDSIMQNQTLFAAVGAAHLGGNDGMLNMLKEKGYRVRPVSREITEFASNEKEKIENTIVEPTLKMHYAEDSLFGVKLPGKYHVSTLFKGGKEYLYADIANGNQYSILRASHYGKIDNYNSSWLMDRIDSLFFEYIPGDIQDKQKIFKAPYPGYDIRSIDKKKNHIRYNIFITPLEILVFKLTGKEEFAISQTGNEFFNSIQFNEISETTVKVNPKFSNFEVELPGNYVYNKSIPDYINQFTETLEAYNQNAYYMVQKRSNIDFSYIEENEFESTEYLKQFCKQFNNYTFEDSLITYSKKEDYSAACITFKTDSTIKLQARSFIIGGDYYIMAQISKEIDSSFFESFKRIEREYDNYFTYEDTLLNYSVKAPFKPKFITQLGLAAQDALLNEKTRKEQDHYSDQRGVIYFNDSIQECVEIERIRFQKYFSFKNQRTLKEYLSAFYEKKKLEILAINSKENKDGICMDYIFHRKNSDRRMWYRHIIYDNYCYILKSKYKSGDSVSSFINTFYTSFKANGKSGQGSVMESRISKLLDDLKSEDSLTKDKAKNSISVCELSSDQIPNLISFLQKHENDLDFKARKQLYILFGEESYNEALPFLKNRYLALTDTAGLQISILESLADISTIESYELIKELILEDTPLSSKEYGMYSFHSKLRDSIELCAVIIPDLMELSVFPEYKSGIYTTLNQLQENGLIKKRSIKSWSDIIKKEAEFEMKRQMAADYENGESYGSYPNHKLKKYFTLLKLYTNDKDVKKLYEKAYLRLNPIDKISLSIGNEGTDLAIHDTIWNRMIQSEETAFLAYKELIKSRNDKIKDSELLDGKFISSSCLTYKKGEKVSDSTVLLREHNYTIEDNISSLFIFKTYSGKDQNWKLSYVNYSDKNLEKNEWSDITIKRDIQISPIKSEEEQIQEIIDAKLLENRRRAGNNYNSYSGSWINSEHSGSNYYYYLNN